VTVLGGRWSAAIDFGGTLTDIVVRGEQDTGEPERGARDFLRARPSVPCPDIATIDGLLGPMLRDLGVEPDALELVAVTGGRSQGLAERWGAIPLVRVAETEAIERGGVAAGADTPALVVSLGTGTALVVADPPEAPKHLVGSGIGGGTLIGLARLLLGTGDVEEISELARSGDPARCDLRVGDILGGGIGAVPAEATAAHFGRVGRAPAPAGEPGPGDIAAALVNLVGQAILRLAFEVAMAHRVRSIMLLGHLLDVTGFRRSIERIPLDRSFVRMAVDPGFAIARGALLVARGRPVPTA
jgi:type II pantothenate kinase